MSRILLYFACMRFPRFHFGIAITLGLSQLCMSAVPVFADGHVFVPTPDIPYVYVTNYSDDTVSVIDPNTNVSVDTVSVGGNPNAIAVSKTGTGVYVANYADGTVSVINRLTNRVEKTITVGTSPAGIAITPDDTEAYVANSDDGSVSLISLATGTVTHTIAVGNIPIGVAISPDGQDVYVTNSDDNSVSVISTVTKSQVAVISSAAFNVPMPVTFSGDGMSAYVGNDTDGKIVIINTRTRTVAGTIDTHNDHQNAIAFVPGTTKLYVTSVVHDLAFFDNLDTSGTGSIAGIDGAEGIAFVRDGTSGYIVGLYAGQVFGFDVASNIITSAITVGSHPNAIAIWDYVPSESSSSSSSSAPVQSNGGHRGDIQSLIRQATTSFTQHTASSTAHSAAPSPVSSFQMRTCDRVMKWFKNDAKMLERVNERLQKRFRFICQ